MLGCVGGNLEDDAEAEMQSLDVMIARLRLMAADIAAKEHQLEGLRRQYREQHHRIVGYALYSEASLETTLGLLREVRGRQGEIEETSELLSLVRKRVESELESLQLTRGVEQARAELAELRRRQADPQTLADTTILALDEEIRRLQNLINEASDQAARNIERR